MSDYVLGTGDAELARLAFQHEVWRSVTERLIDGLGLRAGAGVADLGCGPGLALAELRARVGSEGSVLAVDESERWGGEVRSRAAAGVWDNVRFHCARLEELELEPGRWSGLFLRWVLSFLPDPGGVLARLAPALAPGGAIAILDYNHEGLSLFPHSEGFRAVVRATRALYASRGGDLFIAGRLPRLLRAAGLEPEPARADVLCGGPQSPAFRWADAFFPEHSGSMVAAGLLAPDERELFLREWSQRKADRDALFFSPLQVSIVARRR